MTFQARLLDLINASTTRDLLHYDEGNIAGYTPIDNWNEVLPEEWIILYRGQNVEKPIKVRNVMVEVATDGTCKLDDADIVMPWPTKRADSYGFEFTMERPITEQDVKDYKS
jgi:hypothetical protein